MSFVIRIDPTKCRGHAVCALFHPDGIELDRWGYGQVVAAEGDDRRSARRAARAVAACPNGAVLMMEAVTGVAAVPSETVASPGGPGGGEAQAHGE